MAKHLLLIDSLSKLSLTKDTSLLLALTLQDQGHEVSLLFEDDFFYDNGQTVAFKTSSFRGSFSDRVGYLDSFSLGDAQNQVIDKDTILHFRLDPPFDTRYLRYLWMLKGIQKQVGLRVINDPGLVCEYNEKMLAYMASDAVRSFVGSSLDGFKNFLDSLRGQAVTSVVLKPLDLYQGIGVEKVDLDQAIELFMTKRAQYQGAIVAQPFLEEIHRGEKRAIFFAGQHLGSILKRPAQGEFLANIAQGAAFGPCDLSKREMTSCLEVAQKLDPDKVPWIAFDLLEEKVQEANITCPGLLVEVSHAAGRNLAQDIVHLLS